jgi:sigma-B regulation protein RsbU (phosphoserine phosphatase)
VGLIGLLCYIFAVVGIVGGFVPTEINPIIIEIAVSIALIGHFFFFNTWLKKRASLRIQPAFLPILAVGGVALLLLALTETDRFGSPYTWSQQGMLLINALFAYAVFSYFLLLLLTFARFILAQRRKNSYRSWRIFVPLLCICALVQIKIAALFPPLGIILCLLTFAVWLPLLLQLRWVVILNTSNKWLTLLYVGATNIFGLCFIVKLSYLHLPHIILEPRWGNLFILLLVAAVLSYGIMLCLVIVFGMPVASFIAEQRAEIASFQHLNRLVQDKVSAKELLEHLFDTCLKNTDSDAGWLIIYEDKKETIAQINKLSSEQIGFLKIKSRFKEIVRQENANAIKNPDNKGDNNEPNPNYGTKTSEILLTSRELGGGYYFPHLNEQATYNDDDSFVKSMLILPVHSAITEQLLAMVCICKAFADGYNDYMIALAKSYVAQTQLSIEHLQLVSETLKSVRYKREWEIASRVQQALMPKQFPHHTQCDIAGFTEPAVEVGGDYYDYARNSANSIALIMGDVSGKGASAAFHMAQMKGIFQSLMQFSLDAHTFMQHANHAVARCLDRKQYITIAYLLLDFDNYTATYSRAGHCPMLYYSAQTQQVSLVMGQGTGLGIIRNESFSDFIESQQITLHGGDILLLYTDGLVEGRLQNSDEQYGYERLKKCLLENQQLEASKIVEKIYADYKIFTTGSDFKDDTSLLVVKIK